MGCRITLSLDLSQLAGIDQPPETQVIAAEEAKQRRSVLLALTALAESIDPISPAAARLVGTYDNSPIRPTMTGYAEITRWIAT